MERVRCEKYERIAEKWDTEIEGYLSKGMEAPKAHVRTISERRAASAKISKARSLNTHLIRCPVCR